MGPLGFETTPDAPAASVDDPTTVPVALQTPELKAELIESLEAGMVGDRHDALGKLAGWDPDPEVAAALRPMLRSDDVFEAGQAATGLARQGDITDLPGVLDLVYRLSPADGGTTEAMVVPLRAALALAALANPDVVAGVKERATQWRGTKRARRQSWEHEFDTELDELLAP